MDTHVAIPGSWLLDPLLRGRHMSHWVSVKRECISDTAVIAVNQAILSGKDPSAMQPWWVSNIVMMEDYETYRKLYESMDDRTREKTADDLEQHIGLTRVRSPLA